MKINPRKPVSMTTIRQLNERKTDKIIQTYTTANKATQTDALQNKETQTNFNHPNKEKKWENCFLTSSD